MSRTKPTARSRAGPRARGRGVPFLSGQVLSGQDLWTPAQLGDDLALWLDVWDSDFDLRTDGGTDYVERWGDLSGNGHDATQGTGSEQPEKLNGVIFDKDYLSTSITEVQPFTLYVLAKIRDSGELGRVVEGGNRVLWGLADGFQDESVGAYAGLYIARSASWPSYELGGAVYDASSSILLRNGTEVSGNLGSIDITGRKLAIGYSPAQQGEWADATVLSVIFYRERMGTENRRRIEGSLAHKADRNGTPEPLQNLPSDHPYKDSPPTV